MSREKTIIYKEHEIEAIRVAAQASALVLDRIANAVVPGMSTLEVDNLAGVFIKETGGKSCFLGYNGYPRNICVSLNNEVVHGIGRADRIIQPGDIVSLDVGVSVGGYCGDNARTVCAGYVPDETTARLLDATRESMYAGIAAAVEGNRVYDIGRAVDAVVRKAGFSTVRDMVGHGCGKHMHEPPEVPNYFIRECSNELKAGMVICIEPMVNVGTWKITMDKKDGWTIRTADGLPSAHFENQILITKDKPEILTCLKTTTSTSK